MIDKKQHPLAGKLQDCTGCAACAGACPENAITMQADEEGFLHSQIDLDKCNDCGLCRQICPVNRKKTLANVHDNAAVRIFPPQVFAAWHLDNDVRRKSSSGGVFSALADDVFSRGGVVVGAAFDENMVVRHLLIENPSELHLLRGSKYVQSDFSPKLYQQIEETLKKGRKVLFSGTPCQVAGLRGFLRREYDELFCCDIVCHGVPSPLLFSHYIRHNLESGNELNGLSFRDKTTGWKHFSIRQYFSDGTDKLKSILKDPYMVAFLYDYALRPSCYACAFTTTRRFGDLTIADFWGVANKYPEYDLGDKGTSLLLVNTKKGATWLDTCRSSLFLGPADLDTAIVGNPMLVRSSKRPVQRNAFYQDLGKMPFSGIIRKYHLHPPSLFRRLAGRIKRRIVAEIKRVKTIVNKKEAKSL